MRNEDGIRYGRYVSTKPLELLEQHLQLRQDPQYKDMYALMYQRSTPIEARTEGVTTNIAGRYVPLEEGPIAAVILADNVTGTTRTFRIETGNARKIVFFGFDTQATVFDYNVVAGDNPTTGTVKDIVRYDLFPDDVLTERGVPIETIDTDSCALQPFLADPEGLLRHVRHEPVADCVAMDSDSLLILVA
jgi:hypothetical protein